MKLLLDTHALLWMITDDPRLSIAAKEAILTAEEIRWSIVSLWEIGIKESVSRFDMRLAPGWHEWIPAELKRNNVPCINVNADHCRAVSDLPMHHRDPFDRMLIAKAQVENLTLVTCDSSIKHYAVPQLW